MKFWQSLAFVEMDQMVELARFCEDLGFHGVSYGDHLVTTKDQVDEYLYRDSGNIFWNPDTHWPDPWVMTAALAQATSRLHFLSTIYILPLRDPLSAAKALSTAAVLSHNRVTLGAGVGWQKAEFEMTGQDFHTRGKRADEMLQIIPRLLSGEMTEFHGKYYDIPPVKMSPGTGKPLPIMIGGYAPAAMRRACPMAGWPRPMTRRRYTHCLKHSQRSAKSRAQTTNPSMCGQASRTPAMAPMSDSKPPGSPWSTGVIS